MRVRPDHAPVLVAETTMVLWDATAGTSWRLSEQLRADFEQYAGEPVRLRERPRG